MEWHFRKVRWRELTGFLFWYFMKHLDKVLYNNCINNAGALKALALFVYVKQHKPCSVFPNYTIERMSSFCKLSKNTIRKRMLMLNKMGLIERVGRNGQHILFKKARKKRANIEIGNIHYDSVKEIEYALRALLIREIQRSKDWLGQRVFEAYNPKSEASYRSVKRSLRICRKRGINKFTDNGISWRTLAKRLNCSLDTVGKVIAFGEKEGFFKVNRRIFELVGESRERVKYSDENNLFISRSGRIFQFYCNTYSID